jgi:hypothetical protein
MTVTMINVYQGKQPKGSFDSEGEANAYIVQESLRCRSLGIDCKEKEFRFSTKPHVVEVAESEVVA